MVTDVLEEVAKSRLTVADICRRSGLSRAVVIHALRAGKLSGLKIGKSWYISEDGVRAWLRNCAAR